MEPQPILDLERRTFRAAVDDGLFDLLLGGYLLAVAGGVWMNRGWLAGVAAAIAFPAWFVLRKAVTEPRLGYVKLNPARRTALRRRPVWVFLLMAATILAGVWLGGQPYTNLVFPALVFAVPLVAAAFWLEIPRFYAYAGIIAAERALDALSGGPHDWVLWPSGLLITVTGVHLLAAFLRRYPAGAGADV